MGISVWVLGHEDNSKLLTDNAMSRLDCRGFSTEPLSSNVRSGLTMDDIAVYIFTSGTTG